MHTQSAQSVRAELFHRSDAFTRSYPKQFLYMPFSRKLYRRTYCYTHARYDLWARLESDQTVKNFNEMPGKVAISCDGKIGHVRPAFAVERRNGAIEFHLIDRDEDAEGEDRLDLEQVADLRRALEKWCAENQLQLVVWTLQSLRENAVHLANIKQLLSYICTPHFCVSSVLLKQVDTVLRKSRFCTVDHVLNTLSMQDKDSVVEAIAEMILEGLCFSDIDRYKFQYSTQLSVHHEID